MKKRQDLLISSGKLEEEDRSWDIKFWQSATSQERFKATCELLRTAYKTKTGEDLSYKIDKKVISQGSYS